MTKPRTPEEIAEWLLDKLGFYAEGGRGTGDNALKRERILAALREAAGAAEQKAEARIASLDEQLEMAARAIVREKARADAARREERDALRERLTGDVEHWKSESQKGPIPWSSNCDGSAHEARNLLAWLDARSRPEEPKKP